MLNNKRREKQSISSPAELDYTPPMNLNSDRVAHESLIG